MSTDLIKHEGTSLADTMTLGDVFRQSGYFTDIRDKAQAVVKILCGRELGLTPVVSMMGIHIISGKPSLSSNLMAALIKRSGRYDYRVTRWDDAQCTLTFREKVDGKWEDVGVSSFSMEDAERAQVKTNSSWKKFPKAMLFARALSQGLRAYCPDVSSSPMYNPEELGAEVNEEGDVITVESQPVERKVRFKKESVTPNGGQVSQQKGAEVTDKPAAAVPGPELITPAAGSFEAEQYPGKVVLIEQMEKSLEHISLQQQKDFHFACRNAVAGRIGRKEADDLTAVWLLENGYIDENDSATSKEIPLKHWPAALNMAVAWMRKQ